MCFAHNGFQLGLEEPIAQAEEKGLTPGHDDVRLDMHGSVSALVEVEDHWVDSILDEQYRRFIHVVT